jgi:hypothetical protein
VNAPKGTQMLWLMFAGLLLLLLFTPMGFMRTD